MQLCSGPNLVKNALNSATSSSMLSTGPMVQQEQASELIILRKGTGGGGAGLRPTTAACFSPPALLLGRESRAAACLSRASFPWEGRSHLELHLELQLTWQQEGGWGQRPGSNLGQSNTNQWGASWSTATNRPQEKFRKPHSSAEVLPVQVYQPRMLKGRPTLLPCLVLGLVPTRA